MLIVAREQRCHTFDLILGERGDKLFALFFIYNFYYYIINIVTTLKFRCIPSI